MKNLFASSLLLRLLLPPAAFIWPVAASGQDVPLGRCDTLPVIEVVIAQHRLRLLVDTAATSVLNVRSFTQGKVRADLEVSSWAGTLATSAREVRLPEFVIGGAKLAELKLPAIDLSPIAAACGQRIDGILGVDLLGRLGATIDLKRQVLHLAGENEERSAKGVAEMLRELHSCEEAFNRSDENAFFACLEPKIVLFAVPSELYGREQVMEYLRNHYLHQTPAAHLALRESSFHAIGQEIWYEYEFTVKTAEGTLHGRGMAMCRKSEGHWRIASLQHSVMELQQASDRERWGTDGK
jgi:hypothetical protein